MADYIIATSSTSDLTRDWLDEHGVPFIPYTYTIGNDVFEDDCREESRAAIYAGMRKGDRLKTSMINEVVYSDFFRKLLNSGKDVIFLDMSQKMSVSYKNALSAAKQVQPLYPDQKLYIMVMQFRFILIQKHLFKTPSLMKQQSLPYHLQSMLFLIEQEKFNSY